MLVLDFKPGAQIVINDELVLISVVDKRGHRRIAFKGPKDKFNIKRMEIINGKQNDKGKV